MNKKAETAGTFAVIIAAVMLVLILLYLTSPLKAAVHGLNKVISHCEKPNVLVEGSCPTEISSPKVVLSDKYDGLSCCIPKNSSYESELKTYAADINTNNVNSLNIDSSKFTFDDENSAYKPVVFQVGESTLDYKNTLKLERNKPVLIKGGKLFKEGTNCELKIVKVKKVGDILVYGKQSNDVVDKYTVKNNNCDINTILKINIKKGLPGNYKYDDGTSDYYAVILTVSNFDKKSPWSGKSATYWAFIKMIDSEEDSN